MLLVGLTGGIGAGKTTVAGMLAERGAVVIDADELARRAVVPGTDAFARVVESFGRDVIGADGDLDREWIGRIVFADEERRRALEAIVHPEVARLFAEAVEPYRDTDDVVVYSVPLLAETGLTDAFDLVVVVVADVDRRIERLLRDRGMEAGEVRARVAAQFDDEERAKVADVLIDNDGDPARLESQIDRLWAELAKRPEAKR